MITKEQVAKIFGVPVESVPKTSWFEELERIQHEWLKSSLCAVEKRRSCDT